MLRNAHLQQIVALWSVWEGSFKNFCRMVATDYRLPYGVTYIGSFFTGNGLLKRRRRRPLKPLGAAKAGRTFSLEPSGSLTVPPWPSTGANLFSSLISRPFSILPATAVVGFSVADSENAEAIRSAYIAAKQTAGSNPLGCTVDNKPPISARRLWRHFRHYTPPGHARSGPGKGTTGGLFRPLSTDHAGLIIEGNSAKEMARCVLKLVLTAWYRGRNGKPRQRLGGLSPREAYASAKPSKER